MQIKKITHGFVVQTFDTKSNQWVSQDFVAGDDVVFEDEKGNSLDEIEAGDAYDNYLPFSMVQPEPPTAIVGRPSGKVLHANADQLKTMLEYGIVWMENEQYLFDDENSKEVDAALKQ